MNIRYATEADLPGIEEMYDEFKGEEFVSFGMTFDKPVTQQSIASMIMFGKVIICETGGKIVSMIAGLITPSMTSKDVYFVGCFFFVQQSFRTFTTRFLKEAINLVRLTKSTQFIIAVPNFSSFEKSERFYSMAGFKILETHWVKKL